METCKSCGAEIMWRKTAKGVPHPIDPIPHEHGGNIVIQGDTCHILTVAECTTLAAGTPRYMSHFATCSSANKHRKKPEQEKQPMQKLGGTVASGNAFGYGADGGPPALLTPEEIAAEASPKPKKRMLSEELAAMSKIDRILSSLPESTRLRVLRWLGDPSRLS